MTGPDHARFRDDPGAFLLGALSDDEQRAFELHMEQCPDCREEVERLRPAADALPRSVEQVPAPDRLKSALMDIVESEARGAPGAARPAPPPARPASRPRAAAGARRRPARARPGWPATASPSSSSDQDQRTIAAKVDDSRVPMASAELRIDGDGDDGAVLSAEGLPDLGGRRVYQAWVLRGDKVAPAPTFVADARRERHR